MTDWLRDVIISLGVFLGLVSPQTDPVLNCRIFRQKDSIYYTAEIENAINSDVQELILASNKLAIYITAMVGEYDESGLENYHIIFYDLKKDEFEIYYSETNKYHRTNNSEAAFIIFKNFYNIPIIDIFRFQQLNVKRIRIKVEIRIMDETNFDAKVLWNYKEPSITFEYNSIYEIPY